MSFLVWFFTSVEHVVVLIRNALEIKKAKFFGSLVFFTLILSACAMPAGDEKDVKNKAYLESTLDQEQLSDSQANSEKSVHSVFSSDAFAAVRSAIGGAQVNQLSDKIPIALAETAINKTENLINQKANEMANSVGHGKTQISLRQLETKNPDFSIKTIQPLTNLTDESTQLTFTQAQVSSGENHGERRATINLGIGQRYLLEDGQSIAGINLFTDYETESKHSRASLGLEYRRANFSANVNTYHPLSYKVVIGDYTEEPLAGYDIRLTGQVPYLPWAKIKGTQYYWDAITGDNIKGTRLGIEADINASTTFEIGTENSNIATRSGYARLRVQLPYNANPASTHYIIADKAFEDSTKLSLTDLNYVERSNKIRIEKLLNHGAATVANSTLTASPTSVAADGTTSSTIMMQAKDANNNILSAGGLTVTMSESGSAALSSVTDNNNGTYTATITNTTAETVTVAAAFGGANVTDTAAVSFTSTAATVANSTLTASPTTVTADGTASSTITMQAKDVNNNNLSAGGLTVTMSESGSAALSSVTDNNNGTYTATITNTTPETVTVTAAFGGSNVTDTVDVIFAVTAATVANSTLTVSPTSVAADGSTSSTIMMQAKDANNNNLSAGGLTVTMSESGSAALSSVTDNTDGTYTATITSTTAETVTVTASFGGANVTDTAAVSFTATAATVANSTLTASPTTVAADGTASSTITMQAKDANNNNLSAGGLTVTMSESGSAALSSMTDNNDGTYTATITNTTAETVTVTAAFGGANVTDTVDVIFAVTAATVSNSTLTASPTSVAADGSTSSTITMQAKDANNNNLSAGGLTVTMSESGSATLSGVSDVGNGTYTATITNTTAETVTVTAAFGGANVTDTVDVSFTFVSTSVSHGSITYNTIESPYTGKSWLDKNLGATSVCADADANGFAGAGDEACYGDYYQWGRDDDGHELAPHTSANSTGTKASSITPGTTAFITSSASPYDWTTVDSNGSLRSAAWGDGGVNDICPIGFRVPTTSELVNETTGATISDSATAFSNFLKLPVAGNRNSTSGGRTSVGSSGYVWSSTASGADASAVAIHSNQAYAYTYDRLNGYSVRCIRD